MNWALIIIPGILIAALVIFLIVRNMKDEKIYEKELDNDYPNGNVEDVNDGL